MQAMPAASVSSGTSTRRGSARNPHHASFPYNAIRPVIALLFLTLTLTAQPPAISPNGITNAASRKPLAYPGGALAPGARFRLEGARLTRAQLLFDGQPLPIPTAAAEALEALVPAKTSPGTHAISVRNGEGTSAPQTVPVVSSALGIYTANQLGWGRIDPPRAYRPGDPVTVSVTGRNKTNPNFEVAGLPARTMAIRPAPTPGIERVDLRLPVNVPSGCAVPLSAGQSNFITLTIGDPAQVCAGTPSRLPAQSAPARIGLAAISRLSHWPLAAVEPVVTDEFILAFRDGSFSGHPALLLPPPGACILYTGPAREGLLGERSLPRLLFAALTGTPLAPISRVRITAGTQTLDLKMSTARSGDLLARIGWRDPANPHGRPLFFNSPSVALDFGSLTLPAPLPFNWSNRADFQTVSLTAPKTFSWTGTHSARDTYLLAAATDTAAATSALAVCTAPEGAQAFTLPAALLTQLAPRTEAPVRLNALAAIFQLDVAPARVESFGTIWRVTLSAQSRLVNLR